MADVLSMATIEIGDPIALLIFVKADNLSQWQVWIMLRVGGLEIAWSIDLRPVRRKPFSLQAKCEQGGTGCDDDVLFAIHGVRHR